MPAFAVRVDETFITKKKRGLRFSSEDNWRWPRPTWIFATRTGACACMFTSINCEFIAFESLNDKDFSSGLVEIFLFSNCFKYTYYRAICPIQLRPGAFCLFAKQNRTNHVVWVRLVRLSSVIELTEKFDYRTNWTTIRPIGFDSFLVRFRSIDYAGCWTIWMQWSLWWAPHSKGRNSCPWLPIPRWSRCALA